MRSLFLALSVLGCSTMKSMHGARPLEPGARQMEVGASLQMGSTFITESLTLPLPQLEVGWRRGLAQDLDAGLRVFLLGGLADVRYRFYQDGPWHIAIVPGLGLSILPFPAYQQGNVDLHLPLLVERELGKRSGLTWGPRSLARYHFIHSRADGPYGQGSVGRYELLIGGGARLGMGWERVSLGISLDALANTTRGGLPWASLGADLGIRRRDRRADRAETP